LIKKHSSLAEDAEKITAHIENNPRENPDDGAKWLRKNIEGIGGELEIEPIELDKETISEMQRINKRIGNDFGIVQAALDDSIQMKGDPSLN
jgi:hypothetical protein